MANNNDKDKFFDNVLNKLRDLKTLEIRTLVGEITYKKENNKDVYSFKSGNVVEGMITKIDLIDGDSETQLSPEFAKGYEQLREFHMLKESQGRDIIQKNIDVLEKIGKLILKFTNPNEKLLEKES